MAELMALKQQLNGLFICHEDVSFYYHFANVRAFRTEGALVVTVHIPVSHFSDRFTAVNIRALPMPSHMDSSGPSYMQLQLNKNVLLYSDEHRLYCELDVAPDRSIAMVDMRGKAFLSLTDAATCAAAILQRNIDKQRTLCEYKLHKGTPQPQLFRVDDKYVFVAGTNAIQLQCTKQDMIEMELKEIAAVLRVHSLSMRYLN